MEYFDSKKSRIFLGDKIGQGGEATVSQVAENPQSVAKIYHDLQKTPVEKLQLMLENVPLDPTREQNHISIAWPTDIIFNADGRICGYIMPVISSVMPLFKIYNPGNRLKKCPDFNWKYLHNAARNLAAAVSAIHEKGYIIGDLNESNILVHLNSMITIIDTDSFQVRNAGGKTFHCPVGKDEYIAPEIQGCRLSEIFRTEAHDSFALGVIIFLLLMEGSHPFRGKGEPPEIADRIKQGLFPYELSGTILDKAPKHSVSFFEIHPELRTLFCRCFSDGQKNPQLRPSASDWVNGLDAAEKTLKQCSVNPQHYYHSHSSTCLWCLRKEQTGIEFFPFNPQIKVVHQKPLPDLSFGTSLNIRPLRQRKFDGIDFVLIPPGTFLMGIADKESFLNKIAGPQHKVNISKGFWLSLYPVTQGQWKQIMDGHNPSFFSSGDDYPVEYVSWNDIAGSGGFLDRLNKLSGYEPGDNGLKRYHPENVPPGAYRLPTEAEWEYACRAGQVADFHYGQDKGNKLLTDYAWYRNNSSGETKPVGQKNPNAWGLYDMTGNVYEWVWDWHGNYVAVEQTDPCGPGTGFGRVCRGGSWKSEPWKLSSWFRQYFVPGIKNNEIGFRICKQA